ncbi:NUDIX domain-containing protein [Mesobacterium pallidum]|uniref:NUDIX domain-containing protein n=1 Tax=Mesobacterium pallidum TaxID=2872037 RepID=UPI001EE2E333|nr:NUDIX hydrolase [Mesobacterium pallidum]
MENDFSGAKAAVFIGRQLVVLRRDDKPDIPWPGRLDFPGGARDPGETPEETVLREIREEIGLRLSAADLGAGIAYQTEGQRVFFYVVRLPEGADRDIVFGDEGQGWALMAPGDYMSAPDNIPHLAARLARAVQAP